MKLAEVKKDARPAEQTAGLARGEVKSLHPRMIRMGRRLVVFVVAVVVVVAAVVEE
jgi:hypothetical protein